MISRGEEHKPNMRDGNTLNLHMVMVGCAKYSILMNLESNTLFKIDPGKGTHSRGNLFCVSKFQRFFKKNQLCLNQILMVLLPYKKCVKVPPKILTPTRGNKQNASQRTTH